MRRRKAVKAIALSTVTPHIFFRQRKNTAPSPLPDTVFASSWHEWPDVLWAGPECWGNRLQDWRISDGQLVCVVSDVNRSLHCLTCQLTEKAVPFEITVHLRWLHADPGDGANHAGLRLGAKGKFDDYRSAAVFGEGLNAGITGEGKLFIKDTVGNERINAGDGVTLVLQGAPEVGTNDYAIRLTVRGRDEKTLGELVARNIPSEELTGNIALVSHCTNADKKDRPSVGFSDWRIAGAKATVTAARAFGPVCFAQYTVHQKRLKLTAQLAPVERVTGCKAFLQIRQGNEWKTVGEADVDRWGRTARFRVEGWSYAHNVPYRVRLDLPLKGGIHEFFYEGEIAREPLEEQMVKMAVFSCNCDYGFPDADVPLNVSKHKPDLAVFLGDQFYESTGGFGIQTSPKEEAALDYLRKWYMFGWSYRDIFRNIPSVCIPDDHDVYHGNVWGEGGKAAPTDKGWGYDAQDQGGYKMPAEWVNMVQQTQTSHLPDPYDPARIKQGIEVYYTAWNYAGISMAILEDRKFKSAPKNVLPPEAKVVNGFIQHPDYDIREHDDVDAELLGERQMKFLQDWSDNWRDGAEMKVVLSQTNFCTVATLPKGSIIDNMVPRLPIPEPGEYVVGDMPTADMDSNGWPQKGRNDALKVIRKCFALHIAGDQHLASMVHYGVDEFGDAGFAFAGPALNNLWPRRWWPPVENHSPLPGKPPYTGNFEDGFGNKMTVLAVANPRKTNKLPSIIHDRATGYGMVTFDKEARTMTIECWPRYADPTQDREGQYTGWPLTIKQEDNYGRKPTGYLPSLQILGLKDPVIQVVNEKDGAVQYTLRIKGNNFKPKVFEESSYTIKVTDPDRGIEKIIRRVKISKASDETLRIKL